MFDMVLFVLCALCGLVSMCCAAYVAWKIGRQSVATPKHSEPFLVVPWERRGD